MRPTNEILIQILDDLVQNLRENGYQVLWTKNCTDSGVYDNCWVYQTHKQDVDLFGLYIHENKIKVFLNVTNVVCLDIGNPNLYKALLEILKQYRDI